MERKMELHELGYSREDCRRAANLFNELAEIGEKNLKGDIITGYNYVPNASQKEEKGMKKETKNINKDVFKLAKLRNGVAVLDAESEKIPVRITRIDSKSSPYTSTETIIECLVLHGEKLVNAFSSNIKDVIFNDPATIVFWKDGSKTVVKCQEGDVFDPEKGLAMAICKKAFGNESNFNNVFTKWIPECKKAEKIKKTEKKTKKSVVDIACEVIEGKWYSGAARKSSLKKAGYDYAEVMNKVNELRKLGIKNPKES